MPRLTQRPYQILIASVLGLAVLIASVAIVEAATTPWSCDNGGNNVCPSGSKYSHSKLQYTVLSGSGNETNWRFDVRTYGGSNGYSGVSQDKWRLVWGRDFSSPDGQSWTRIASYGSSPWRGNNAPWSDYTIGSSRTVNSERGISWFSRIEHKQCSPHPQTGCSRAESWITWGNNRENSVFN